MREIGVALLVALGACYSPSYMDCQISCNAGSCPSGLLCENNVCRTPGATGACGMIADANGDGMIDGPPGDVDGDTIPNADDNCPNKANRNQANEDGDMFGDVCDPCPPFSAPADNMDSDGDGVGDSCDPSPNMPGNTLVVFEGFKDTVLPPGAQMAGNWTFPGGTADITNTMPNVVMMLTWPTPMGQAETIMTRFTVTGLGTTQFPIGMGGATLLDTTINPFSAIACWVVKPDAANPGDLHLDHVNAADLAVRTPDALNPNRTYTTDLTRRTTTYSCSEPMAGMNLTGNSTAAMPMNSSIGVFNVGVNAKVEWVMIISGP